MVGLLDSRWWEWTHLCYVWGSAANDGSLGLLFQINPCSEKIHSTIVTELTANWSGACNY